MLNISRHIEYISHEFFSKLLISYDRPPKGLVCGPGSENCTTAAHCAQSPDSDTEYCLSHDWRMFSAHCTEYTSGKNL